MTMVTRSQAMAQEAYSRITARDEGKLTKEYSAFARGFPALIHTCGLAQAVAFALAKNRSDYIDDLSAVLRSSGHNAIESAAALDRRSREAELSDYFRLSHNVLEAAGWLKRYVEACEEED